ncbi:hypothetical protein BJX66DRAFT_320709 [Aspergillus keveii]|uniref:Uncharacterized protein n=1 Tax=Aspergillus keveii TaxID=714993 RepID=A0ABR4FGT0_9EURO
MNSFHMSLRKYPNLKGSRRRSKGKRIQEKSGNKKRVSRLLCRTAKVLHRQLPMRRLLRPLRCLLYQTLSSTSFLLKFPDLVRAVQIPDRFP